MKHEKTVENSRELFSLDDHNPVPTPPTDCDSYKRSEIKFKRHNKAKFSPGNFLYRKFMEVGNIRSLYVLLSLSLNLWLKTTNSFQAA